ncbi:MAG: hypothetical protein AAB787_02835 [Patescibacteria group bacterium]
MSFETPNQVASENPEEATERYRQEAEDTAKILDLQWKTLSDALKKDAALQAKFPKLVEIDKEGGIARWFELQVNFADSQHTRNSQNIAMFRLKEDLREVEKWVEEILR